MNSEYIKEFYNDNCVFDDGSLRVFEGTEDRFEKMFEREDFDPNDIFGEFDESKKPQVIIFFNDEGKDRGNVSVLTRNGIFDARQIAERVSGRDDSARESHFGKFTLVQSKNEVSRDAFIDKTRTINRETRSLEAGKERNYKLNERDPSIRVRAIDMPTAAATDKEKEPAVSILYSDKERKITIITREDSKIPAYDVARISGAAEKAIVGNNHIATINTEGMSDDKKQDVLSRTIGFAGSCAPPEIEREVSQSRDREEVSLEVTDPDNSISEDYNGASPVESSPQAPPANNFQENKGNKENKEHDAPPL